MVRTLRFAHPTSLRLSDPKTDRHSRFKCQRAKSKTESSRPPSRGAFRVRAVAKIALENREGAGKAGCWPHPWSACKQKAGGVTTGSAKSSGLPCAMVLTVSFVLSPGTGLSCPRHPQSARCALKEFSASVGAPGPHDFSVRDLDDRLSPRPRPSHPAANVRDDRERPSCRGRGMAEKVLVICPTRQARSHAACWRDGQMAHGMHARIACRARSVARRLEAFACSASGARPVEPGKEARA
jgi:hypothetical protein